MSWSYISTMGEWEILYHLEGDPPIVKHGNQHVRIRGFVVNEIYVLVVQGTDSTGVCFLFLDTARQQSFAMICRSYQVSSIMSSGKRSMEAKNHPILQVDHP